MKDARIISDQLDNDIAHVYVEYEYTLMGSMKKRWLLAASMHKDLIQELFGKGIAKTLSKQSDIKVVVCANSKEKEEE